MVDKNTLFQAGEDNKQQFIANELDFLNLKRAEIENLARSNFLELRNSWAFVLLSCIALIVIFNIFLVICVGIGWLNFKDEWFLRLVFLSSFAEVWVLAKIIVEFLFKEPPKV